MYSLWFSCAQGAKWTLLFKKLSSSSLNGDQGGKSTVVLNEPPPHGSITTTRKRHIRVDNSGTRKDEGQARTACKQTVDPPYKQRQMKAGHVHKILPIRSCHKKRPLVQGCL
ncbi:hypothetical protein PISMIDRAFT_682270 [Pisolithus microcarpus 441]|uniref:Uncharacterized protein n=1 Tax=Pisolithus microcarpus 441 TaxID=765257 RepID=A0A0C9YUR3_9AGAM|nr:hypothetical protein PISMIDRAFT_682270 [Pisolithus microcarpus 441]